MKHTKKHENVATQQNKKLAANIPEEEETLNLLEKYFTTTIINILKDLEGDMDKSGKSNINKMRVSIKVNHKKKPNSNSRAAKFKNSLEGFDTTFQQVEERISKLKDRAIKTMEPAK